MYGMGEFFKKLKYLNFPSQSSAKPTPTLLSYTTVIRTVHEYWIKSLLFLPAKSEVCIVLFAFLKARLSFVLYTVFVIAKLIDSLYQQAGADISGIYNWAQTSRLSCVTQSIVPQDKKGSFYIFSCMLISLCVIFQ